MGWRMLVGAGGVSLALAACGGTPAAAPTAETTSVAPTTVVAAPTAARASSPATVTATSSAAPAAPATAQAQAAPSTVYVANTDGQGVFVRKTPAMADRLRAYPDGTPLTITGDDVDADGQHWHHVKTPDGVDGYVPAIYTVDNAP